MARPSSRSVRTKAMKRFGAEGFAHLQMPWMPMASRRRAAIEQAAHHPQKTLALDGGPGRVGLDAVVVHGQPQRGGEHEHPAAVGDLMAHESEDDPRDPQAAQAGQGGDGGHARRGHRRGWATATSRTSSAMRAARDRRSCNGCRVNSSKPRACSSRAPMNKVLPSRRTGPAGQLGAEDEVQERAAAEQGKTGPMQGRAARP